MSKLFFKQVYVTLRGKGACMGLQGRTIVVIRRGEKLIDVDMTDVPLAQAIQIKTGKGRDHWSGEDTSISYVSEDHQEEHGTDHWAGPDDLR